MLIRSAVDLSGTATQYVSSAVVLLHSDSDTSDNGSEAAKLAGGNMALNKSNNATCKRV